jgi:D-3-phosphoglycerate dehydrogenase
MNYKDRVAVCSRSFSRNAILRAELSARYKYVTFNDVGSQMKDSELITFLKGHNKAITALEKIDKEILSELPELKVIGKYGVGIDMIDLDAMREYGVRLGWTGGVNRRSVAELTLAFAIVMLRSVMQANREVVGGAWRQIVGGHLTGRTVGIIGCGHVGKELIRLLKPFECKILVNDIQDYPEFYSDFNVQSVEKEELLVSSDIVTLHVPLDDTTFNMISAERINIMKHTAILINVARGGLVDEGALKKALKENKLGGAAFDVFSQEPPKDIELLGLPNFLATPHIGGSAEEAILAMGRAAIEGLEINEIPLVGNL